MFNASQANDGNGHMQTPHKFDILVQKKINQNNRETFRSKNYVHVFGIILALWMVRFHRCKVVPFLSWAEFKLHCILPSHEGKYSLCRQRIWML